jgi:hypothetical protein
MFGPENWKNNFSHNLPTTIKQLVPEFARDLAREMG